MLRRVSASFTAPQQRAAVAAASTLRWCSANANANTASSSSRRQQQPQRRYNSNSSSSRYSNSRPTVLPPAFDIVHWNDENLAAGHLLRVIHQDSFIVLDYHKQASRVRSEPTTAAAEGGEQQQRPRGGHAERVVTVTLPPVYIARFLGVLEGRAEKVDVQSRFTNATFVRKAGAAAEEKSFTLSCVSRRPTTGQQQTVDGQDVAEESVEWTVEMNPAESLMLHRFLTQALQYNTGFGRNL